MNTLLPWILLIILILALGGCANYPEDRRAMLRVTNGAGDVQTVPTTTIYVEAGGLHFIDNSSTAKDRPVMNGTKFTIEKVN